MANLTERIIKIMGILGVAAGMLVGAYSPIKRLIKGNGQYSTEIEIKEKNSAVAGAGIMLASGIGTVAALDIYRRRIR